jgi:hypothetical protein
MKERWVKYPDKFVMKCSKCGAPLIVYTKMSPRKILDGRFKYGDPVRCSVKGCVYRGEVENNYDNNAVQD